jgi:exonuclease III
MPDIYKGATLNINALASQVKMAMLEDFVRQHEIDFLFLQEVTQPKFDNLRSYTAYTNIGTNRRGTAILASGHLPLTRTLSLLSGRVIAASFQGVRLVNIYALSGAEKRQEREHYFNLELPYLLIDTPTTMIMGGDYNCVFAKSDATGNFNFSRALDTLNSGYDLVNLWAPATG